MAFRTCQSSKSSPHTRAPQVPHPPPDRGVRARWCLDAQDVRSQVVVHHQAERKKLLVAAVAKLRAICAHHQAHLTSLRGICAHRVQGCHQDFETHPMTSLIANPSPPKIQGSSTRKSNCPDRRHKRYGPADGPSTGSNVPGSSCSHIPNPTMTCLVTHSIHAGCDQTTTWGSFWSHVGR